MCAVLSPSSLSHTLTVYPPCVAEKVVPANCNVYYAINTAHDLNFVLRPKRDAASADSHRGKEAKSKRKLLMLHHHK